MLSSDFKPILLHASHQQNSVWAKPCVPRAFPALFVSLSQFLQALQKCRIMTQEPILSHNQNPSSEFTIKIKQNLKLHLKQKGRWMFKEQVWLSLSCLCSGGGQQMSVNLGELQRFSLCPSQVLSENAYMNIKLYFTCFPTHPECAIWRHTTWKII